MDCTNAYACACTGTDSKDSGTACARLVPAHTPPRLVTADVVDSSEVRLDAAAAAPIRPLTSR